MHAVLYLRTSLEGALRAPILPFRIRPSFLHRLNLTAVHALDTEGCNQPKTTCLEYCVLKANYGTESGPESKWSTLVESPGSLTVTIGR